jgi:DNA-binding CsgD family transcriptional regulator
MNIVIKGFIITLLFSVSYKLSALPEASGHIKGILILDDSWERNIYISYILSFEKKFAVSDNMIIASSPIDSIGRFTIELDKLPVDWSLLRLHIVKKGNPPASLVIGGQDENYYFIIANRSSKIELKNSMGKPIFKNLFISGAPYMNTFEYITNLSAYPNTLNYENSLIEKEFIEEVVSQKLKSIADTCKNPLVSLYALYQTDFYADYRKDHTFYSAYLSKWGNYKDPYFESFKRKFPVSEKYTWKYILILSLVVAIFTTIFFRNRKKGRIKKLSVQERKIFELLQEGASNQEIADKYNIELSTVKSHVSNIFSKLNIKSRKEVMNLKIK